MRDEPKTFLEHLGELRRRLVISAFAVLAGTIISFIFNRQLFDFKTGLLTLPLRLRPVDIIAAFFGAISRAGIDSSILDLFQLFFRSQITSVSNVTLFSAAPMEKFMVVFKACFLAGAVLAAPILLYEVWMFVLPALKHKEKRYLIPLFFITLFFFLAGAIFCFFIVIPISIPVLAGILPSVDNQWRLEYYFSFVTWLTLAFGAAFELPVVMGFIAKIGLLNADSFRRKRKIAIVLIFIAAAIITPTQDPFTMSLMAIPLVGLYEIGIRFAVLLGGQETPMLGG